MKDTNLDTPLVLAEESLIWRLADGEVIVPEKRTWSYLALNESGAELDAQSARRDVDAFVSTMHERQLVRLGDGD